jgi:hypothetical protein
MLESKSIGLDLLDAALADDIDIALHVSGHCMKSIMSDGDTVSIRRASYYLPGEIIAYRTADAAQSFIHRYLGCIYVGKTLKHILKADDANRPDTLILCADILGKVNKISNKQYIPSLSFRITSAYYFLRHVVVLTYRRMMNEKTTS